MKPEIKMLSLWQPWASLCVLLNPSDNQPEKQIETRHWKTEYRGLLAIHAAKKWDWETEFYIQNADEISRALAYHFASYNLDEIGEIIPRGAIVGVAELTDCIQFKPENREKFKGYPKREWSFGDFEVGRFGWILKNVVKFDVPVVCRGLQGLGKPPEEIRERILEQL